MFLYLGKTISLILDSVIWFRNIELINAWSISGNVEKSVEVKEKYSLFRVPLQLKYKKKHRVKNRQVTKSESG